MKKILCVDDEVNLLTEVCEALVSEGYEVIKAENGEEAMSAAYDELPDLILLDIVMPDLSGYEVAHSLQIHPETSRVKIIFVTGNKDLQANFASRCGKSYKYLRKPYDLERLKELVGICIRENETEAGVSPNPSMNSDVDRITGMYDKTHIMRRLDEELKRASTHNYPFSALKLVVTYRDKEAPKEHEKDFHKLADDCSRVIGQSLRAIDIGGRLGGLDFMILLPRLGKSAATLHAQRLRNDFQSFEFSPGIESSQVKINIGIRSCDECGIYDNESFFAELVDMYNLSLEMGSNQIYSK